MPRDLTLRWVTDLRNRDLAHNQPVQTFDPNGDPFTENPPAAGWSAPLVVGNRIYLGSARAKTRTLNSFVFCLDADSGNVVWIFCTNQYGCDHINRPNELPEKVVRGVQLPPGFTVFKGTPLTLGCSVWGCIAYDETLKRLYCPTGNGVPDGSLPTPGWSNGLLALDAVDRRLQGVLPGPGGKQLSRQRHRCRRRRLADAVRPRAAGAWSASAARTARSTCSMPTRSRRSCGASCCRL